MKLNEAIEGEHLARSNFVRGLVQRSCKPDVASSVFTRKPPKRIVQFWNDMDRLPEDVKECIESWRSIKAQGFELLLFDEGAARNYISRELGARYEKAYDKCYHPAMQSDYFRLCYILVEGGCYVDADDVYQGQPIEDLFSDGRLKVQPLCYDMLTDKMVPSPVFTKTGAHDLSWIFYFNNNPLIAASEHPIVEWALAKATLSLEQYVADELLPDIQSTTGPGNLTKSIFDYCINNGEIEGGLAVLNNWDNIAVSRWPLSYRDDERNWRLSDRKDHREYIFKQLQEGMSEPV